MARTIRATVAALGVLAVLLAAGCGDSEGAEPSGPAPTRTLTEAPTAMSTATVAPTTTVTSTATAAPTRTAEPAPTTDETTPPPVACGIDINSREVQDALASLPEAFPGAGWVAERASDECNTLAWVQATVAGATGSSPNHVLFFVDRSYVGTATAEPYAFSYVLGDSDDTVTVRYRWLLPGDPNANPTGGPADIRYRWDGSAVVMLDPLPPEVTG